MQTSIDAVSINNLSFSYDREMVLSNISLSIKPGEYIGLIGPNGGGKTTLLKLILGFLKPSSGCVNIFGKPPDAMRSFFGYVPQFSTLNTSFPASVLEVVLMGGAFTSKNCGSWKLNNLAKEKALGLLANLGLEGLENKQITSLSGGQRQRALVARALMAQSEDHKEPFILIMDEPTASLDPKGKFCFFEFLQTLRKDITVILVNHDLLLASPFFTTVAFVNHSVNTFPGGELTLSKLSELLGEHLPNCPLSDNSLQHTFSSFTK